MPLTDTRKAELTDKVAAGERLTRQDGEDLYDSDDLAWLGALAHGVRTAKNGDAVYFNVNRHLNLTNVCAASCAYCSFQRKPGQKDAYTMRVEEAVAEGTGDEGRRAHRAAHRQRPAPDAAVEVLPAGAARAEGGAARGRAEIASPPPRSTSSRRSPGCPPSEILDELIDAGLESLTGGGAEIFDWEVRKQIVDHKTHWEDWSRIHRLAHGKGLRTPATMLYGHIEEPRHRVDHVLRLRELQDETGGFQVFIPLRFHNDNNRLSHLPMAQPADVLKTFAVSPADARQLPPRQGLLGDARAVHLASSR